MKVDPTQAEPPQLPVLQEMMYFRLARNRQLRQRLKGRYGFAPVFEAAGRQFADDKGVCSCQSFFEQAFEFFMRRSEVIDPHRCIYQGHADMLMPIGL